jgi:hypothetical protein
LVLLIIFLWLIEPVSDRSRGVVCGVESSMFVVVGLSVCVVGSAVVSTSGVNPGVFVNESSIKASGLETSCV